MNLSRTDLRQHLEAEVRQRREEGCDVTAVEAVLADRRLSAARLEALLERLERLKVRPDFAFKEPSRLEEIRRLLREKGLHRIKQGDQFLWEWERQPSKHWELEWRRESAAEETIGL